MLSALESALTSKFRADVKLNCPVGESIVKNELSNEVLSTLDGMIENVSLPLLVVTVKTAEVFSWTLTDDEEVKSGATAYDIIGDAIGNASPTIRAVIIFLRHFLAEVTPLNSPINV